MIGDGGILGSYFVYQAQTLSCTRNILVIVMAGTRTDTYKRIPRASAQTNTVVTDSKAAHTILMATQGTDLVSS